MERIKPEELPIGSYFVEISADWIYINKKIHSDAYCFISISKETKEENLYVDYTRDLLEENFLDSIRKATSEEIQHLEQCIRNDEYVDYDSSLTSDNYSVF